jgi:hypothetical protein
VGRGRASFDDLVGAGEQRGQHSEASLRRLGSLPLSFQLLGSAQCDTAHASDVSGVLGGLAEQFGICHVGAAFFAP